jgi:type IV fimbrial biogenesis protein FimT
MRITGQKERGVTLIELVVVVAIIAITLGLGAPSFNTYIQNRHIRNAAEAIQNGLNLARTEAVRRNVLVKFVLGTGSSWTIGCSTAVTDSDADGVDDCPASIQAYGGAGATNASVATSEVAAASGDVVGDGAFTSTLEFNGVGRVSASKLAAGDLALFDISNPSGGSCASAGPMQCLRVVVSSGGEIRMCDPSRSSSDPQGC